MKVYCVVLFQCFLFALSNGAADTAPRPALINIGALFNFNSTIGKVAKIAIQEAVDDIYSNSSILNGYTLNITLKESVCNGFLGFVQAIQLMQKEVVAIIGPQSSAVTHMVSLVATELQIPLLSFAATDPTIKPLNSPFFVRTTLCDDYQMTAISEIIDQFGWREIVAVFDNDDYGRNGIAALDDALADKLGRIDST